MFCGDFLKDIGQLFGWNAIRSSVWTRVWLEDLQDPLLILWYCYIYDTIDWGKIEILTEK